MFNIFEFIEALEDEPRFAEVESGLYQDYVTMSENEKREKCYEESIDENGKIVYEIREEFKPLEEEFNRVCDETERALRKARRSRILFWLPKKVQEEIGPINEHFYDYLMEICQIEEKHKRCIISGRKENMIKAFYVGYLAKKVQKPWDPIECHFNLAIWPKIYWGLNPPGIQKNFTDFEILMLRHQIFNPKIIYFFNKHFSSRKLEGEIEPIPRNMGPLQILSIGGIKIQKEI